MKSYIVDAETDALVGYTKCWNIVLRDADTGKVDHVLRNLHEDATQLKEILKDDPLLIGHNIVGFDYYVLNWLLERKYPQEKVYDTLVVSRLLDYNQKGGHSLEAWGTYFKYQKSLFNDFSQWSQPLEDRCIIDTEITYKLYVEQQNAYKKHPKHWENAYELEHKSAWFCETLHSNGFHFDIDTAQSLLQQLTPLVQSLEAELCEAFLPKAIPIRTITPTLTKKGTLHLKDFRWMGEGPLDLSGFSEGHPYTIFQYEPFNPRSSKQRVERLNAAGWKPVNKTKGHLEALRSDSNEKLDHYRIWGWTCDEENLATLPETAPPAAHKLKQFLLLSNRLSTLTEWMNLYNPVTKRIHGRFYHIGAWTHRMSHSNPNMANVPSLNDRFGRVQPYGTEFRSLWSVPPGHCLVGCDAEGIQLRLFAHFCNDSKLIEAIANGNKDLGTDIHTLNQKVLGTICNSRGVAKTYIYALLLGAGKEKQAHILSCTPYEALAGLKRILEYYPGWQYLKDSRLREDAKRGHFVGLDKRLVLFPAPHYILAGYLQNGESVVMKRASLLWSKELRHLQIPFRAVDFVHDEWQTETLPEFADKVGQVQADSIRIVGEDLGLNCPLAGNYNIGMNWKETH